MTTDLLLSGLQQSLILALITYAVMIPFRLLNLPDLTAEGAYPLGGAMCTSVLLADGHPLVALLIATLSAGVMGVGTALIHLKLRVNTLLAGIILSTMMYSVNLRIMGKPNVALFEAALLFDQQQVIYNIALLLGLIIITVLPLALFLRTELGLTLLAVGLNQQFAQKQGISVARCTLLGLFLAGGFTGLAGGLMVQLQNYMAIGMGVGIVIHALAALMVGEALVGYNTLNKQLLAPIVGALLYQQIQGLVLSLGLAPSDLKFFTGGLVLMVIALKKSTSIPQT